MVVKNIPIINNSDMNNVIGQLNTTPEMLEIIRKGLCSIGAVTEQHPDGTIKIIGVSIIPKCIEVKQDDVDRMKYYKIQSEYNFGIGRKND